MLGINNPKQASQMKGMQALDAFLITENWRMMQLDLTVARLQYSNSFLASGNLRLTGLRCLLLSTLWFQILPVTRATSELSSQQRQQTNFISPQKN